MEVRSASCPQGLGFQQLREAVSEVNPRKRTHPHDSPPSQTSVDNDYEAVQNNCEYENERGYDSSTKRSRITEWPLKNTVDSHPKGLASPSRKREKATSSHERVVKKKAKNRLSRFQEGSLNDKPSKKPPQPFLGAEDAMERYHAHGETDTGKDEATNDAGMNDARPSGAFRLGRFGKAVANVFNGFWKEKQPPVLPLKDPSQDDKKAKAEDAYALLKLNGFKEMQPSLARFGNENFSATSNEEQTRNRNRLRDSAIEMDIDQSQRSSMQTGRLQDATETLKPPSNTGSKLCASPASGAPSGRRSSSLHLRTPSFQTLKKVKSQIYISSMVRTTEDAPPLPTPHDQSEKEPTSQSLRRQPSKKELAKHQRLSKKVSDLEYKLDTARRELEKSLQEAPPVPDVPVNFGHKRFNPRAPASLPSERLLTPQTSCTPNTNTEIYGSVVVSSKSTILSSPSRQLGHELRSSISKETTCHNEGIEDLMSSDPLARPDVDRANYASWVTAQATKDRRRPIRDTQRQQLSIDGRVAEGTSKRESLVSIISRDPIATPADAQEVTPQVPAISVTAEDANMPRPTRAFLGPPGSDTPVRTRSKNKKRGISPPPPSVSSASKKKPRFTFLDGDDNIDTTLTPTSAAGNRQKRSTAKSSPAPKAVQMKAARARAVKVNAAVKKGVEKPLPEIQQREENFEWDEDVF